MHDGRNNHSIIPTPIAMHHRDSYTRGFTLTEVMFAVILLGIGFIMVAAMFPVALRQTKLSLDETIAAQLGRSALGAIEVMASDNLSVRYDPLDRSATPALVSDAGTGKYSTLLPTDGNVEVFHGALANTYQLPTSGAVGLQETRTWESFKGVSILKSDPRYAWTMVYRRDGNPANPPSTWGDIAQVYIFLMERAEPPFAGTPPVAAPATASDVAFYAQAPFLPNLAPKPIRLILTERTEDQDLPDLVTFVDTVTDSYVTPPSIDDGAFIVVSRDPTARGKVYRVGPRAEGVTPASYELLPGWDMPVTDPAVVSGNDNLPARAIGTGIADADQGQWGMIFGKGYSPGAALSAAPVFEGNNMAVYMYVGFVRVH